MTTPPTILSEQVIRDAADAEHWLRGWSVTANSALGRFARTIESAAITAYAATLAQGVELEGVAEFRGRRLTPNGTTEFWGWMLCDAQQDPVSGTQLVPLSAAQAAVAAERAPFAEYLKDGETPIQRLERERADMLTVTSLLAKEKRRSGKLEADLRKETAILDWLSMHTVNVRSPMPKGGSLNLFWASPDYEDEYQVPSNLRAQCLGAMGTGLSPSPAPAAEPVPADRAGPTREDLLEMLRLAKEASANLRRAGRAEAMSIILGRPADSFLDDLTASYPIADTGDYGEAWKPEALADLLDCGMDNPMLSLLDRLEAAYWDACGRMVSKDDEIERLTKRIASSAAQVPEDARDAARYRWLRLRAWGERTHNGEQDFGFPRISPVSGINVMRGSVAQHLDAAIDAAIAAAPAAGGEQS